MNERAAQLGHELAQLEFAAVKLGEQWFDARVARDNDGAKAILTLLDENRRANNKASKKLRKALKS